MENQKWDNDVLTVRDLLLWTAERYEDKPCIKYVEQDNVITKSYREMCEDSFAVCRYIREMFKERLHVVIIGKTNYEYISCLNGIFVGGNVAVPMAYDMTPEDTAQQINDSDAQLVFYDGAFADRAEATFALCPKLKKTIDITDKKLFRDIYKNYNAESDKAQLSDVEIDPDDCTVIIYTSGTTGEKKGAMLSSRAIISNVYYKELSYEGENVALNVLPMYHIFCFSCDYLKNLKDGVNICLNGDIANINANLLRFEPTVVRMVPMVLESLVRRVHIVMRTNPELSIKEAGERVLGRRLRNIIAAGAALSPAVADEFEQMGINIRQGYGMTETGPRISVPDGKTCATSCGRIISICKVRIENGEIQVKSPSLMMGYYKRPEETKAVFTEDGWFKTGDMGRISPDNELFITGRLKNVIILSNGENVSPEEIEKKFIGEPLIKEILVYEDNGKIAAQIYPDFDLAEKTGVSDIAAALQKLVDDKNAADAASREIDKIVVREIPLERTSTGKIIRR